MSGRFWARVLTFVFVLLFISFVILLVVIKKLYQYEARFNP